MMKVDGMRKNLKINIDYKTFADPGEVTKVLGEGRETLSPVSLKQSSLSGLFEN